MENNRILSIYCTAGYPHLESLPEVLTALDEEAVSYVEVGIPFSDPLADGPTIQASNTQALENGMTLERLFEQLSDLSLQHTELLLMGYWNSVLSYGPEAFCERCKQVGVRALIIPDLPFEIYMRSYAHLFDRHGLSMVFIVTPETETRRIMEMAEVSKPFLYAVSSASTTGSKTFISNSRKYLERLSGLNLEVPILTGFNVSSAEDFELAAKYTNGAIVGSAFIRAISGSKALRPIIKETIQNIRKHDHSITA